MSVSLEIIVLNGGFIFLMLILGPLEAQFDRDPRRGSALDKLQGVGGGAEKGTVPHDPS